MRTMKSVTPSLFRLMPATLPNGVLTAANINFRVTADASGWVAIGFSNDQLMPNSDIIMMTGEGEFQDAWANARAAPEKDVSQDATLHAASQNDGQTSVEFSRPLNSGDEDDLSLDSERFLLWAFNQSSDSFTRRHSSRGFTATMLDFGSAETCLTVGGVDPDFNDDGNIDTKDIDSLVAEIVAGANNAAFDLSGDTLVNSTDLDQWRNDAAIANGFSEPYLLGDANLDGTANAADLNTLGIHWLSNTSSWTAGDFTADGIANAADLNVLGLNWQSTISIAAQPVPEPSAALLLGIGWLFIRWQGVKRWK